MNSGVFTKVMFWNEDNIGVIAINNGPENYLDQDTMMQLTAALTIANNDINVNWVALTGTGYLFFSAGVPWESIEYTYTSIRGIITSIKALLSVLAVMNKPVVTILNGSALGLGMELALISDLTIAPPDVYLCYPEGSVGVPMPLGSNVLLSRLPRYTAINVLTGEPLSAKDAGSYGLVHLVDRGNLFGDAKSIIRRLRISEYTRRQLIDWVRRSIDSVDSLLLDSLLTVLLNEGKRGELFKALRMARLNCKSKYSEPP